MLTVGDSQQLPGVTAVVRLKRSLLSTALFLLGSCSGGPRFGAEDEVVNPRIVNGCDVPIEAQLLRSDLEAVGSSVTIPVGANPRVSAGLWAFDGVDAYLISLTSNGRLLWLSDPIALSFQIPEIVVVGTCGEDAMCTLVDDGHVECAAITHEQDD